MNFFMLHISYNTQHTSESNMRNVWWERKLRENLFYFDMATASCYLFYGPRLRKRLIFLIVVVFCEQLFWRGKFSLLWVGMLLITGFALVYQQKTNLSTLNLIFPFSLIDKILSVDVFSMHLYAWNSITLYYPVECLHILSAQKIVKLISSQNKWM